MIALILLRIKILKSLQVVMMSVLVLLTLAVKKALEVTAITKGDDEIADDTRDKFINSIQLTLNAHQTF